MCKPTDANRSISLVIIISSSNRSFLSELKVSDASCSVVDCYLVTLYKLKSALGLFNFLFDVALGIFPDIFVLQIFSGQWFFIQTLSTCWSTVCAEFTDSVRRIAFYEHQVVWELANSSVFTCTITWYIVCTTKTQLMNKSCFSLILPRTDFVLYICIILEKKN